MLPFVAVVSATNNYFILYSLFREYRGAFGDIYFGECVYKTRITNCIIYTTKYRYHTAK